MAGCSRDPGYRDVLGQAKRQRIARNTGVSARFVSMPLRHAAVAGPETGHFAECIAFCQYERMTARRAGLARKVWMTEVPRPHIPVMLEEVLAALGDLAGKTILDGTFGAGGYTRAILDRGAARVIGVDRDPTAIAAGAALVTASAGRLTLCQGTFSDLEQHAGNTGALPLDGIVLDIGVSSMQIDQADRGFSFRFDGPLDMRMDLDGPSAADLVNSADVSTLARIFSAFGEERHALKIAKMIAERRLDHRLATTAELASLCETAYGFRKPGDIHPATRVFQALRIAVNHELDELVAALGAAERALKPGGCLVVVAFHSLEDRIVKRFFADRTKVLGGGSRHVAEIAVPPATFNQLGKGYLEAGREESLVNPRARSAKLRYGVRTGAAPREIDAHALGLPDVGPRLKSARKGRC